MHQKHCPHVWVPFTSQPSSSCHLWDGQSLLVTMWSSIQFSVEELLAFILLTLFRDTVFILLLHVVVRHGLWITPNELWTVPENQSIGHWASRKNWQSHRHTFSRMPVCTTVWLYGDAQRNQTGKMKLRLNQCLQNCLSNCFSSSFCKVGLLHGPRACGEVHFRSGTITSCANNLRKMKPV